MKGKKNRRKSRGFITVFVTLMMVPVVVCTGTMVDVARLKMYSSQAAMAADSYGEVVLSEYDNLLKELYGLFSLTQNKEGLQALEEFQKYTKYSFNPNGDNIGVEGFMPYENAKVEVSYENVPGASLSNNNVLMTQISDFMKFRVVEELMDDNNILKTLEMFDHMSADMDVVNSRNKLSKKGSEALEKVVEYFEELEKLNDYPDYIEEREYYFEGYSAELKSIYESEDYEKYVYYLENKDSIDAAKERVEEAEKAAAEAEKDESEESSEDDTSGAGEDDSDDNASDTVEGEDSSEDSNSEEDEESAGASEEDKALAEQYVDVEAYKAEISSRLSSWENGLEKTNKKIIFGEAEKRLGELDRLAKKLESILTTIEQQIRTLQAKLPNCSQDIQGEIKEEIAGLEKIADMAEEFKSTVDLLFQNNIVGKDKANKRLWKTETEKVADAKSNILAGKQEGYTWEADIEFEWYDFQTAKSQFYSELAAMCRSDGGGKGNKKAADEKIEHAEDIQKNAQSELEADEETEARDITGNLAAQLKQPGSSAEVPDIADCFSGGASFASIGNGLIGKFLLTTYDFGMFSSRVTGIKPPTEDEEGEESQTTAESSDEEYVDVSLTDIEMSKNVNYLYGAELEYLLGGHNKSVKNLNHTRNIICGVRMTTNYLSSYSVKDINRVIKNISNAAAKAVVVASGGTLAAAESLIRVAVSGALRLSFATLETVNDWKLLKDREEVIFYKRELGDLTTAPDVIAGLLGENVSGDSESDDLALTYEEYMYVLMCLFVDEDTLLDRTSNLITLNVNQSQNSGDTLSTLNFKMADTVTAVKSTCKVNEKFLIVPENFVNMYLTGTETESMIQRLDDGSYGYSVIRGY